MSDGARRAPDAVDRCRAVVPVRLMGRPAPDARERRRGRSLARLLLVTALVAWLASSVPAQGARQGPAAVAKALRQQRRAGDVEAAIARAEGLPAQARRDARVHGEHLNALLDAGRLGDARALVATAELPGGGLPAPLAVALVRLQFRRGDVDGTRENLAHLLGKLPEHVDLRALEARLWILDGRFADVDRRLAELTGQVAPAVLEDLGVELTMARAAEFMGDDSLLSRAAPLLEGALERVPARHDLRALTIRALVRYQRFEQAEALAAEALDDTARSDPAVARAVPTPEDADRAELLYARGFLHRARMQDELARADFAAALELVPEHAKALVGMARCHNREGEGERAREYLDRALAADERSLDALLALADIEAGAGDNAASIATLERVLAIKPNHLKALWQLSRTYARERRLDESAEVLARYEQRVAVLAER